jgi:hypothetical protein
MMKAQQGGRRRGGRSGVEEELDARRNGADERPRPRLHERGVGTHEYAGDRACHGAVHPGAAGESTGGDEQLAGRRPLVAVRRKRRWQVGPPGFPVRLAEKSFDAFCGHAK